MFVPVSVFTNKNDKEKETTGDGTKHHHHKEEANTSKIKVENNTLGTDKEIVQVEKFL